MDFEFHATITKNLLQPDNIQLNEEVQMHGQLTGSHCLNHRGYLIDK
jgi:hypothetical protein